MAHDGIIFGGGNVKRPGAFSVVDSSNMVVSSAGSFRSLAFIGLAPNLKAGTDTSQIYYFSAQSTQDATALLGGGDLLTHMNKAWSHGADLIAVSLVVAAAATPTDSEWQTAIDRLNKTFVDGIVPITTAGAVQTKVDTHVQTMSAMATRRERRAFYGHAKGLAKEAVKSAVLPIGNERAVMATPAVYDFDASGAKVLFDSTLLAAAVAGLWVSKEPQDPLTYDYVKFPGIEVSYEATDIADMLASGLLIVEETRRGFRIVQGLTCALGEDDLTKSEISVSTLKDVMSMDMRDFLEEKHVGKAGVAGIEVTIYNDAMSRINEYKDRNKWISAYVDGSLKVVKNGTAFYVDWEGSPTLPINNFLITSHFTL